MSHKYGYDRGDKRDKHDRRHDKNDRHNDRPHGKGCRCPLCVNVVVINDNDNCCPPPCPPPCIIKKRGPQGRQGPQGEDGPQGKHGPQGPKGDHGVQGHKGPQGVGKYGPQGPQGQRGVQGKKGKKGDKGCPGERGCTGKEGPQGPNGVVSTCLCKCPIAADFCTPNSFTLDLAGVGDANPVINLTSYTVEKNVNCCKYNDGQGECKCQACCAKSCCKEDDTVFVHCGKITGYLQPSEPNTIGFLSFFNSVTPTDPNKWEPSEFKFTQEPAPQPGTTCTPSLVPRFEGQRINGDGTATYYFGYENTSGQVITVPPGQSNIFVTQAASGTLIGTVPYTFIKGSTPNPNLDGGSVFSPAFAVTAPLFNNGNPVHVGWNLCGAVADSTVKSANWWPPICKKQTKDNWQAFTTVISYVADNRVQTLCGEYVFDQTNITVPYDLELLARGPCGDWCLFDGRLIKARGPQGFTGARGPQGEEGVRGPQGEKGPQGCCGPQGHQGVQGYHGPQGAFGPQGHQGVQGPKGDKGDQGEPGICLCPEVSFLNLRAADMNRPQAQIGIDPTVFQFDFLPGGGAFWNPDILIAGINNPEPPQPAPCVLPTASWALLPNGTIIFGPYTYPSPPATPNPADYTVNGVAELDLPHGAGDYNITVDLHFLTAVNPVTSSGSITPNVKVRIVNKYAGGQGENSELGCSVPTFVSGATAIDVSNPSSRELYRHFCVSINFVDAGPSPVPHTFNLRGCDLLSYTIARERAQEFEYSAPVYLIAATFKFTKIN